MSANQEDYTIASQSGRTLRRITMTSSKPQLITLILWAVVWAAAMIASAILLKGNPIKDWIQSALFIAAMTFWVWQSQRAARK